MLSKLRNRVLTVFGSKEVPDLASAPSSHVDPIDSMIPDYSIAQYVGAGGAELYKAVGSMQVGWLQEHAELKETDDVLEVGCGIGRIAAPLTQHLSRGTYCGFDIVLHGIEWCQQRITSKHSNFRFLHSDIHNEYYNANGKVRASEYSFPFADSSFDLVFLTSVFTHMLAEDVENYVSEIGRVLRPGGRCYCTAYLMTADAKQFMDQGQSLRIFRPLNDARVWTDKPDLPEEATGYTDEYLFGVFEKAGMDVRTTIQGEWWKNPSAQDTFVAHRS